MPPTSSVPAQSPALIQDGKDAAHEFLTEFSDFCGKVLSGTEAKAPQLEGDALAYGESYVQAHASPAAQTWLGPVFGFVNQAITPVETTMTASLIGEIETLRNSAKAHLAAHDPEATTT